MTDKLLSILIVEDSESDAGLVIRQFRKADHDIIFKRVETAYQMKTALEDESWDLVISDYNLPEFDAPSALMVLRESGQDIPFIVVSGVIGDDTAVALMKAGANDYIMKGNLARLVPAANRELHEVQIRWAKKQAEKTLLESEAKYRTVIESSLVGVFIVQDGLLCFVNKRWCEIYGYTSDEIVNKVSSLDLTPPEDKKIVEENIRKHLSREIDHVEYEPRAMRKDGTIITVKVLGSFTLYRGRPAISGTVIDITEQKRSEEALRTSQVQLSDAMDLARIVYWETDATDNMFIFNDAFYAFYGTTAEQEGGYRMTREEFSKRFVHPDDLQLVRRFMEQNTTITGAEVSSDLEHRIIRRDGEVRHILVRASVVKDDSGRLVKRYGANQDITYRKHAEEALSQSMKKLRRNLMGTIQAMSSMVEIRDPYTAGHEKRVSMLARAIAHELGLPNDVVDTIRMAASIHDIGKISVPAEILSKPGRLTDIEMKLIQMHSQTGYDILKDVDLPYPIARIVLQHHERLNGSGYPQGVKADEIFLEARIVSVADVVEAMASYRPYRPALGIDTALEEIEKNKGIFYDAVVVDACVRLFREKGFKLE
jgi:PAS domain S-box-containing protein/putative nucleotidyltransferase with HDIG domain